MIRSIRRGLALGLAFALLWTGSAALAGKQEEQAAFEAAAAALQTPDEEALATGRMTLRLGESVLFPSVSPGVVPYDEQATTPLPIVNGTFESADPTVASVDEAGRVTALREGATLVTYRLPTGDVTLEVTVSADAPPRAIVNLAYVARSEFFSTQRARLPKYNKYAKWYYGKKKEVGWCAVFVNWCANACGGHPLKREEVPADTAGEVLFLREGMPSNQYEGFFAQGRFVDAPKPGYLVIYADLSNAYRTTHIGVVVEAEDRGDGQDLVRTIEGNMSSTVKGYCYLYDSNLSNAAVGDEKNRKLNANTGVVPEAEQTDPLLWQYAPHADDWAVFGFCATW